MNTDMQLGKIAEYQFIVDASRRGLLCSIPIHDHRGYDLIVQGKNKLYKVQVKSTRSICKVDPKKKGTPYYKISVCRGRDNKEVYLKEHVDFFAVYIFELSQWYLVPFASVSSKCIRLYPSKYDHRFSKYREAWNLLM